MFQHATTHPKMFFGDNKETPGSKGISRKAQQAGTRSLPGRQASRSELRTPPTTPYPHYAQKGI